MGERIWLSRLEADASSRSKAYHDGAIIRVVAENHCVRAPSRTQGSSQVGKGYGLPSATISPVGKMGVVRNPLASHRSPMMHAGKPDTWLYHGDQPGGPRALSLLDGLSPMPMVRAIRLGGLTCSERDVVNDPQGVRQCSFAAPDGPILPQIARPEKQESICVNLTHLPRDETGRLLY